LKGRKPQQAPAPAIANASEASSGCTVTASTAKKKNEIDASVAASPSMLSSRLNAFVRPISQTTATASPITWFETSWTWVPVESTTAAAIPWTASFAMGETPRRSSTSPAAKTSVTAAQMPISARLGSNAPTAAAVQRPRLNPT
jgi:hypothetical protein